MGQLNRLSARYVWPIMDKIENEGYSPTKDELSAVQEYCTFASQFMFDASYMQWYIRLGLEAFTLEDEGMNLRSRYRDHVNEFPPHVQGIAKLFFETFLIPPGAIPRRKKKSKFAEWIKEFEYLLEVGETYTPRAIRLAHDKHQSFPTPFAIDRPAAINRIFTGSVTELMRKDIENDNLLESTPIEQNEEMGTIEDVLELEKLLEKKDN